jgi:hypothetical protein
LIVVRRRRVLGATARVSGEILQLDFTAGCRPVGIGFQLEIIQRLDYLFLMRIIYNFNAQK